VFIVFEGLDYTGKSTQIELVTEFLSRKGKHVIVTGEPGSAPGLEFVEELVKQPDLDATAGLLAFGMDRAQHVAKVIKPALEAGQIVLCSRFTLSTDVYQGSLFGLDAGVIAMLNHITTGGLLPDIQLVFDIDYATWKTRKIAAHASRSEDFIENRVGAQFEQTRAAYLEVADRDTAFTYVIDAGGTREEVFGSIARIIEGREVVSPDR